MKERTPNDPLVGVGIFVPNGGFAGLWYLPEQTDEVKLTIDLGLEDHERIKNAKLAGLLSNGNVFVNQLKV